MAKIKKNTIISLLAECSVFTIICCVVKYGFFIRSKTAGISKKKSENTFTVTLRFLIKYPAVSKETTSKKTATASFNEIVRVAFL